MAEAGFHFAQPLWFLGLLAIVPVGIWLLRGQARAIAGRFQDYADPHLLPHLTGSRLPGTGERWSRVLRWSLLWSLLLTAMAGPRWDYRDVRLFQPGNNLLVLLDLSRSMLASDVGPNRLGRARQELQDLIVVNRQLRFGLILFASVPHVISPVTEDSASLLAALPALSVDLAAPELQGSGLTLALERAEQLLAGLPKESARAILLISDGDFDEPGLTERVVRLAAQGIRLHALGIGTQSGATVPAPGGGLVSDPAGRPVRTLLNEPLLESLASAGQGIYRRADYRDADTTAILEASTTSQMPPLASETQARVWNERYWLPLLLAVVLMLDRFRRLRWWSGAGGGA